MYLYLKYRRDYSSHYSLLFLSVLTIAMLFYTAIMKTKYITLTPVDPPFVEQSKHSVTITLSRPPLHKQIVRPIQKTLSRPVLKKADPDPVIKKVEKTVLPIVRPRVVPKPIVKEMPTKMPEMIQPTVKESLPVTFPRAPLPPVPLFDAQMKSKFIAGLYAVLETNKKYPKMAKRRKLSGTTHIRFTLHKDGTIEDVSLVESGGHRLLDKAALTLVNTVGSYQPIPDAVSLDALDLRIPIAYRHDKG